MEKLAKNTETFWKPRPWRKISSKIQKVHHQKKGNLHSVVMDFACRTLPHKMFKIGSPKKRFVVNPKRVGLRFLKRNVYRSLLSWDKYVKRLGDWSKNKENVPKENSSSSEFSFDTTSSPKPFLMTSRSAKKPRKSSNTSNQSLAFLIKTPNTPAITPSGPCQVDSGIRSPRRSTSSVATVSRVVEESVKNSKKRRLTNKTHTLAGAPIVLIEDNIPDARPDSVESPSPMPITPTMTDRSGTPLMTDQRLTPGSSFKTSTNARFLKTPIHIQSTTSSRSVSVASNRTDRTEDSKKKAPYRSLLAKALNPSKKTAPRTGKKSKTSVPTGNDVMSDKEVEKDPEKASEDVGPSIRKLEESTHSMTLSKGRPSQGSSSKKSILSDETVWLKTPSSGRPNQESSSKKSAPKPKPKKSTTPKSTTSKRETSKKSPAMVKTDKQDEDKENAAKKPQIGENGEELYEVDQILDMSYDSHRRKIYHVTWVGYPLEEATWEPAANLKHAKEALERFNKNRKRISKMHAQEEKEKKSETMAHNTDMFSPAPCQVVIPSPAKKKKVEEKAYGKSTAPVITSEKTLLLDVINIKLEAQDP